MLPRALLTVLAAGLLAAPAPAAPIRSQTLMPGVLYSKQVQFTGHGPVVLNVVTAPRPAGLYSVHALLSNSAVQGRQRLTDMERGVSGTATVVGLNADFFNLRWGNPSGVLVRGGALVTGGNGSRSAVGFDPTGSLHVDRVSLAATWKGTGQNWPMALNAPPAKNTTTLYTAAWGATTPPESGATEAVLEPFPAAAPNRVLTVPVVQIAQAGSQPIPGDGAVVVARGAQAQTLATEAPVGTAVGIRLILTPPWANVTEAVGGGPVLVRNGRPVFRANEAFTSGQLFQRSPRAAVGQTADGRLLFVAVDGGRPGYSTGMTSFELALAMMRLGAVSASALGTGAYTGLAFDGTLLSRPSGKVEASIADALVFSYSGVYAPPPPTIVAAGKTISLAYKVVLPSTVTATVTGADGTTATIAVGPRAPGSYRVDWTPPATGRFTFSVAAQDDLGRRSTAQRAFTVGNSTKRG